MFLPLALLCHGQVARSDQALLTAVREKYDAPFTRSLESFHCAVDFSWKEHFRETTRVGDEGTDEELENIFQPIRNRVAVSAQNVTVVSSVSDDAIAKLPYGGMAESLLQHAVQKSLFNWLPASTNAILPAPPTPMIVKQSPTGYNLAFQMQGSEIEMVLGADMRLQSAAVKANPSDHFETSFISGPQGFVLTSWTMGEDENFEKGHRLIFTYTYQTVGGMQLPERVAVVRESHHEVWRYRLSGCTVTTRK